MNSGLPLQSLLQRARALVWEPDLTRVNAPVRAVLLALRTLASVVGDLTDGQLSLRAMSLVYTTLLSLVPLLAVSFSVLKAFGVHNQLEPTLINLLAPLGDQGIRIADQIVAFVERVNVGVLGAAGLAVLMFTVVSLVQKIESAVNHTWRIQRTRGFFERFSRYLSVILIGPVLIFSAMGLYASLENSDWVQQMLQVEPFGSLRAFVAGLLPYLLVTAAFVFVYVYIPNTRVSVRAALIGGLVAGALWVMAGSAFAAFVVGSASTAAIYSSFAVLVVFMIWLYLGWLILLTGAAVAFYAQHPEYLGISAGQLRLGHALAERLGLQLMRVVARNFMDARAPWPLSLLASYLRVPQKSLQDVVERLQAAGLLLRIEGEEDAYVPARDLESIRLAEVLAALRAAPPDALTGAGEVRADASVEALLTAIDEAALSLCRGRTLRDLAATEEDA